MMKEKTDISDTLKGTKEAMLKSLEKSLGIVSSAAKGAGISRDTHYAWMKSDSDYRRKVEELSSFSLDFVEGKLFKLINDENPTAIIFYLKTKGQSRGYVERIETVRIKKIKVTRREED